ncbi:MAG: hypothetical protein GY805_03335, partial [Chloroflexi bacterium]|nr:hypothetical protein [Chloroflexota bacterium]
TAIETVSVGVAAAAVGVDDGVGSGTAVMSSSTVMGVDDGGGSETVVTGLTAVCSPTGVIST